MQPRVTLRLNQARSRVLDEPTSAEAWGGFGAVCDAHELRDHAVSCYRRAQTLALPEWGAVYEAFQQLGRGA